MHGHMSGLSFKYPYSLFHYMKDMGLADMKNSKQKCRMKCNGYRHLPPFPSAVSLDTPFDLSFRALQFHRSHCILVPISVSPTRL